jgi:hypothetical protein
VVEIAMASDPQTPRSDPEADPRDNPQSGSPFSLPADWPLCTVYPCTERLTSLARYLGRGHLRVEPKPHRGSFYAVVVNCLTATEAVAHARVVHPGRPVIALVHSLGHPQAAAAAVAGATGLLSLCDPPDVFGECVDTVTRGGRWLAGLPTPAANEAAGDEPIHASAREAAGAQMTPSRPPSSTQAERAPAT